MQGVGVAMPVWDGSRQGMGQGVIRCPAAVARQLLVLAHDRGKVARGDTHQLSHCWMQLLSRGSSLVMCGFVGSTWQLWGWGVRHESER